MMQPLTPDQILELAAAHTTIQELHPGSYVLILTGADDGNVLTAALDALSDIWQAQGYSVGVDVVRTLYSDIHEQLTVQGWEEGEV